MWPLIKQAARNRPALTKHFSQVQRLRSEMCSVLFRFRFIRKTTDILYLLGENNDE